MNSRTLETESEGAALVSASLKPETEKSKGKERGNMKKTEKKGKEKKKSSGVELTVDT